MGPDERRRAYRADITYVTAKESGFDHLRDLCVAVARGGRCTGRFTSRWWTRPTRCSSTRRVCRWCWPGAPPQGPHGQNRGEATTNRGAAGLRRRPPVTRRGLRGGRARPQCGADRRRPGARRASARPRQPARGWRRPAIEPGELRAPCQGAAASRRRLPGARRPHRDDRRDDRPRRAGPAVAGGAAGGARRQRGPGAAAGGTGDGVAVAAAVPARLSHAGGDDRHRAGRGRGVARHLRAPRRGDSDAPSGAANRPPRRGLHPS